MVTSAFPLRKFLDTFVPGLILQIGIWYLYKPYLTKYFPNIVFDDPSNQTFSAEVKLSIFLIIAISLGIIINHMSDIAVALNYYSLDRDKKTLKPIKKTAKRFFWIFCFQKISDERVSAIKRYLYSPRKKEFSNMALDWAWMTMEPIPNDKQLTILHQHLCTRIRILSKETETMYGSFFSEVAFAASLFTTFALLFLIGVLVIPVNYFALGKGKHLDMSLLVPFVALSYGFAIMFNYSLRRRFRQFCSQVITVGLHLHSESKEKKATDLIADDDSASKIELFTINKESK